MEVFQDIPRLYTGIAEWMGCMIFLLLCRRKAPDVRLVMRSIVFLVVQCAFLILTDDMPSNFLWILCMAAAILMMFGFLVLAGELPLRSAAYCCASAFLVAEFAAALEWQLHTWFIGNIAFDTWQAILILALVYGGAACLTWFLVRPQLTEAYLSHLTGRELISVSMIVLLAFLLSNMSFIVRESPFSGRIADDIFYMRTLADLGGLGILYAYQSRVSELLAEQEVAAIQQVLHSQYEQYRNYQESEEMLHILQHDLKHQMDGLRAETDLARRAEWLDAMEQQLDSWRIPQKTGYPVLDTILAAKLRQARNMHIRLTCVADGSLLAGLHVMDICTIFGNALDNAMESVVQIPEEERRLVHVAVTSQKQFTFIQISNTCETEIRRDEENQLLTTKPDTANHGFGLKSIRYSVEKYRGNVSTHVDQGWFELRILIPQGAG